MVKMKNITDNTGRNLQELSAYLATLNQKACEAMEHYKAENPDLDMDALLSKYETLQHVHGLISKRELDKFVTYAKEQGTRMSFDSMEMGVLNAGRKDMQNGLAEILNSLKFEKPICPECDEEMVNHGLQKKTL